MNWGETIMIRILRFFGALRADQRGGVVSFIAISIIPMVAAVGLSVDAARGWLVKSRLSSAIDAAGLAGGRVITSPSRDDDIRMFFNANFPANFMESTVNGPNISVDAGQTTITINATATIPTTFMRVVGISQVTVRADTVVKRKGMELVLVVDNTGSMINKAKSTDTKTKIDAVKDAANVLVDAVYGNRETVENLWVGVVPYVAAVNIGNNVQHRNWTVERSSPSYTFDLVRTQTSSSPAASVVCATVANNGTHTFHDGQIIDVSGASAAAYNVRVLIRLSSITECTINQTTEKNKKFWYVISDNTATTPLSGVTAKVPPTDYSRGGSWSGCVEARVPPYEENLAETLPDAGSPNTMWTRYFWPSTRGVKFFKTDKKSAFSLTSPSGFTSLGTSRFGENDWGSPGYNGQTGMNPAVDERGGDYWAYGPNFGCGKPILPLQPYKSAVRQSISDMMPWGRSGTMSNLGLAWGWRAISEQWKDKWAGGTPGHPVAYNEVGISKVVVLLTDGRNEWADYGNVLPGCGSLSNCIGANGHPNDADYTGYGHLAERRLGAGVSTNNDANAVINSRMASLCTAMKDKKITIYTVVLQENDAATQQLFRDCASDPTMAFFPGDQASLLAAFQAIGAQITKLRLAL